MRFDLTKFPVGEDGVQLNDEKGRPANYAVTLAKGCTSDVDANGVPVRGEEKFKRYDMWSKIRKSKRYLDLTAEEVVYLTGLCRDAFPILVGGQCRDFLAAPEPEVLESAS